MGRHVPARTTAFRPWVSPAEENADALPGVSSSGVSVNRIPAVTTACSHSAPWLSAVPRALGHHVVRAERHGRAVVGADGRTVALRPEGQLVEEVGADRHVRGVARLGALGRRRVRRGEGEPCATGVAVGRAGSGSTVCPAPAG
ncbi:MULTISPECIES: hypothetical protein [Streptomyces]|uniref:hypothetical protein n=1 Tax=Streptomyces TaxID=1883 RepID=UPI0031D62BB5